MSDQVDLTHNEAEQQYEARIDGVLAGKAEYELHDDTITFTHTEVADEFGGRGIAGELARFALDDVRRAGGRRVVPQCPFIKGWIEKHPDYADLVD